MNTDKIYAEHLANEYAPKDTSKVVALRKLDARAKLPATAFTYAFGIAAALVTGVACVCCPWKSSMEVHARPYSSAARRCAFNSSSSSPAMGENTWYFFQMTYILVSSGGSRGRKHKSLSAPVFTR